MEDHRTLLSLIDGLNNGETSQCAQDTNQVFCYRCDARKLVELYRSDRSVEFTPLMNRFHSW